MTELLPLTDEQYFFLLMDTPVANKMREWCSGVGKDIDALNLRFAEDARGYEYSFGVGALFFNAWGVSGAATLMVVPKIGNRNNVVLQIYSSGSGNAYTGILKHPVLSEEGTHIITWREG